MHNQPGHQITRQDIPEDTDITLTAKEKIALDQLADDVDDREVAKRASVVHAFGDGWSLQQIMRECDVTAESALYWRSRFLEHGVDALFRLSTTTMTRSRPS